MKNIIISCLLVLLLIAAYVLSWMEALANAVDLQNIGQTEMWSKVATNNPALILQIVVVPTLFCLLFIFFGLAGLAAIWLLRMATTEKGFAAWACILGAAVSWPISGYVFRFSTIGGVCLIGMHVLVVYIVGRTLRDSLISRRQIATPV